MRNTPMFVSICLGAVLLMSCHVKAANDPCDPNPCMNGGSCESTLNGTCINCDTGFVGDYCEYVDPCLDNPCMFGGTCTASGPDAECECKAEHKGNYCEFLAGVTECTDSLCKNGGECVDAGKNNIYCECLVFTGGPYCGDFPSCNREDPCQNGANCIDTGSGQINYCDCSSTDFTGELCEEPTMCQPNPCRHGGECVEEVGSNVVTCMCTPTWMGPTCEEPSDPCDPNVCENNGTCEADGDTPVCTCTSQFISGDLCDIVFPCFSYPCLNGGTCNTIVNITTNDYIYECDCANGFEGGECQDEIFACDSFPCLNGATCFDEDGGAFTCDCTEGFDGDICANEVQPPPNNGALSSQTIAIISGVVVGILVIIIIVIIAACLCRHQPIGSDKDHLALEMGVNQTRRRSHNYVPTPNYPSPAIPNLRLAAARQGQNMEFNRNRLTIVTKLGSGSFADVYKAEAVGINKDDVKSIVAVKMLKETATENDRSDFSKELSLYMYLDPHPNVVNILGCCTEADPWYLILEYLPNGNLQGYLRKVRTGQTTDQNKQNGHATNIPPNDLLTFLVQIARGMEFLASKACIHRDLAARNILLGENYECKVSDFGLARDLEDGQTYEMKSQGRVPVRWMAPESLLHNSYTSQSDVWSFGILMWEIVTLGSHPYPGMNSKQVIKEISAGYRLPKPEHCSQDIYDLMKECWQYDPDDRPTFTKVKQNLENMLADAQGYLVMSNFNEDDYLYMEPDQTHDSLDGPVLPPS